MTRKSDPPSKREVLTPGDYEALAAFRYAVRRYLAFAERGARLAGLTVELLGRLEKAGFTQRTVDPDDRRKVQVSLTQGGEAVLASLSASNLKELQVAAPAFSGLLGRLAKLDGQ